MDYIIAMNAVQRMDNKQYLIISDLHLTDVKDNADGWKAYKSSKYLIDKDFQTLISTFAKQGNGDSLTILLNGDIFDFDLVDAIPDKPAWPVSRSEKLHGLDATEEKSAWKLEQIVRDHSIFLSALAQFLSKGHKLVYIMGNHDREMHFAQVQQAFIKALERHCTKNKSIKNQIRFEPWFFYESGRLYVEHGQQYDYYTTFKYLLCPTIKCKGQDVLALPMGNLSNRYLMTNMGFFNPHAADFILDAFSYFIHWLRHYAFSKRGLVFKWFFGSLFTMKKLWKYRYIMKRKPPNCSDALKKQVERSGVDEKTLKELVSMKKRPVTDRFFRVMREFWIDRVLIALFLTGATIALALVPIPLWIKLMVPLSSFPLLYFIYEKAIKGISIFTVEHEIPEYAQKINQLLPVKLVSFGHTHKPRLLPLDNGLTFVDTGTWAPIYDTLGKSIAGYNNYLIARFSEKGMNLDFGNWSLKRVRVIRVSELADIQTCTAIQEQVFAHEQGVMREKETDRSNKQAQNAINFIAMLGNMSVGTVRMIAIDKNSCKVEKLAVLKPIRNNGVGKALMSAIEEQATADGYKQILLHAPISALNIFYKLRFQKVDTPLIDARIEHIAMKKTLQNKSYT